MFSVRLVTADSYQAQPLPQLDPTFSVFRGSEIKNVPVIRVFGTTPTGEKTCLHVHGVFPYLYVPYTGEENEDRLAYRLAASLDAAINISLGSANSTTQHVYQIQRVAGIPFYGYHKREHQFFKISFYNPAIMKKAADLLQTGAVLGQSLQPHEAHLNYTLQFMMDYNLYGMSFINLSSVKHRRGNESTVDMITSYDSVITPVDNVEYLPVNVLRQSICELEIDAIASDILNREDLAKGIELNPGLLAIWNEERERRKQAGLGGGDTQLVNPKSPQRPPFRPTDSDLYQEQRLARRLLMLSQADESTLSMSTNPAPYPAEVTQGDVILNASNFGSLSIPTSDKTQRPNETLSLSSLGSTHSSQTSHECSVLDSDDLPLVELLENLARDSNTKETVDEDSVLGTQVSSLSQEEDKSEDDSCTNEDLNLTCLELDSWSSWEGGRRPTTLESPHKCSLTDDEMDSTLLGALLAAGIDTDPSSPQSLESSVPQLDGAGDLCSSLLDSEEEENLQMEVGHNSQMTKIAVCSQVTPSNSSLSPSTSSSASEGTSQDSWGLKYSPITYEHLTDDLVDDIENMMHENLMLEMNFTNEEVPVGVSLVEDETIPIERVLNGDPCFTETAELDKSDLTELQDQYVSLLDRQLLSEIYENSQNLDLINNTATEDTGNCQVGGQGIDFVQAECVIQNVQETHRELCKQNTGIDASAVDENCEQVNRHTSDSSDYNCNVVATWEELHDFPYLPKGIIKRKCTQKLSNQGIERRKSKVTAKSEVQSCSGEVCEGPREPVEGNTLGSLKIQGNQLRENLMDVRVFPRVQYSPYLLGENETLVAPILADFEELTEPLSPGDVPLTSNYCSDRSHRGIIFGEDQHRHCVYSFNHRKFVQDYVFTSNEIWVIEKRKRGKAGTGSVITSKLCNRECRLPCVLLEKINIEESEEQGENIEVVKDLDSISSALPPDDSARNDLDYCTPGVDSIDVDVSVDDTRKERNTFTRITRQSERNFIQSQSSTESGDGPVIIRRVFEEKTSGSTCVKKRKIILKVGSNTDSQSDDSRVEDKSKVSLKTRRKLRRVKDKVPANMAVEDSQELENEINGSASVGDVQCIRQVLPVVESLKSTSRPRIVCSIKTKRLGMKWLLSLTSKHPRKINQMVQSKLPTPQPQIRKVETITQRYKLRVRRREPEGKSIVEPVEDEKVEATTCHVTAEVEVNNSPVLAGLIHGVDVAKGESEEIEPSVSGDKIPVTNDETTPVYTNTVAEVNLYSGKDYTIDAVSQEIPQLLFAEDSNASFNENTINMMSLKRSVDEIEANSTADQSENFSVKSFDGDEYSDHESGILSMADDSGSNGTLNNDVGDSANSPSSFRALLINELQKGKRCERCERCDCNSYMSMLTMSTEGPRTGSLRSEKIFLQEEKMSLVTKSIFRLIGDDTQLNTNTGRGLIENSPDSEDDTLKDVSDKNLDSDFPSEERFSSTPKSSPKSSPKKISILRRIYSSNSEPLHCDEIQGEARGHRGKIFVEDEGSGNHQSSDMNGVQLDCNLSAIDEYKTLSQGDCRDAGGQCLRPLGGVEEGSEVRRQRESYLEVVLEEDHNGELIMGTGEWGNSGKTLSCTETGTGERFNGECGGDSKTTSTAVLADYNYKSGEGTSGDIAGDVARERLSGVENGEMCLSRVEASDGGNLVSIGDDRCTKCLAISQSAVLEKIVEPTVENLAIRSSELIDIDENTQDTFILDTRSDEIETCVQNTIRGIDELSLADTIIMDPSPDNSRDNNDEPLLVDGILGDERSCVMEDKQLSEDAITGDFNSANQVSVVDKNSTDAESIGEGIGEEFGMGNGEIGFDGITMVEKNTGESTNLPSENTRDSELRFVEYIEETVVIEEMRESRITDDDDVAGHSTGGVGVEEAGQREKVFVDDNDTAGISAIVQRETDKDSLSGVGDDDASGVHSTVEKESQKVIEQFIDDNDTIKASIVEKESQGPAESKAVLANDNDNPQVVNQNLPSEQSESPEEYLKADGGDNEDSEALSATGEKVEENLKDDDYSETIDQNNSCPDVPEVQVEPEVRTDSSNIYPITQDPPDLTSLKNSEEGHELSSLNDNEEIEFFNSPETSEDETINVIINNLDHDEEVEESSSTSNKIIPMPVRPNDVTESTEPPEPTENVIALVNRIKHSTETLPNELITLPPDLPTTEVPVPFPKCSRLFVKLERLNADLVAKYLKSLPQKSKEEMPQLKIKKRVRFSSEIIYFGSDEIRPLKDIPDEEYTDTTETALSCVDEPETEETSEVLDKLAIETSQTSTEWKVDGGTPRKDSNTALTRKKSRDSDEDEPKCHKRVKVAEIQPEIIQSETSNPPEIKEENASESTDDLPEIVYDSRSAANSEQQKNVISRSFPQLINVIEVIDVPSDTRDSRQRSVFPPGVMSEVISERILEAEASLLPSESIPRLEFTRMSKMPSKRSRSPSSSIPSVVSIISPQSLESSIFDDIHPAHCNRYVNTYVIQSAYRTKYHTVSVDKRLALTQITTRDSKLRARSSKERFLVQLGLYPLNPNLQENWVVEDRHVAYIQRQEPRVMLHRLNAPTLKRYGYNHRFKSNRSGKRFLNGNDFKIPAYDGPADLTSSDSETSDNETDITVEEREKRVCSYKSIRNKERLTTPSKRKHPESLEESPVAVKCLRTTPKRTPSRPSMLKSPGRLSGNYTPLKIIVTSPKVRREASDTTEQLTIDADDGASAYCLTPRRREQGLHENLLRGRISQATPIQRSGSDRKLELTCIEKSSRDDTSGCGGTRESYCEETVRGVLSVGQDVSRDMNVRKNLFTKGSRLLEDINISPKASTSRDIEIQRENIGEGHSKGLAAERGSLFLDEEEEDFRLKYSTLEKTMLGGIEEEKEEETVQTEYEEDNLCDITFTQYICSQLPKITRSSSEKSSSQTLGDPKKSIKIIPRYSPPSVERINATMASYGIPTCRNPQPFFSKQADAPGQKELAHRMLKVPGKGLADVVPHKSILEDVTGLNRWRRLKINEFHPSKGKILASSIRQSLAGHRSIIIAPLILPPSLKSVKTWMKAREYLNRKKDEKNQQTKHIKLETNTENQNTSKRENAESDENTSDSSDSSIVGPSPEKIIHSNSLRLLGRTPRNYQVERTLLTSTFKTWQSMSPMEAEKSMNADKSYPDVSGRSSNKSLNPSVMGMLEESKLFRTESSNHPGISSGQIECVSNSTRNDVEMENMQNAKAVTTYQYITLMCVEVHVTTRGDLLPDPDHDPLSAIFYAIQSDVPPESQIKPLVHGVIAVAPEGSTKIGYSYGTSVPLDITLVPNESSLFEAFIKLVTATDPEIFIGWELEALSWGYIFQRAATFGVNLNKRISRIPGVQYKWEATTPDLDALGEIKLPGRVVLDIWRIMRHEMALLSYSFENVMYHVMNERIPCPSFRTLTEWWEGDMRVRWKVVEHYGVRVLGTLRILEQLDIIGRTSEHARLFGIQFNEVFTRGSQFRVESIMLRLAKPLNYVAVSPSPQQRAAMRAMEALPLIMEPESIFYSDPVIVLDFQSLYPSIIIAHNYCFSTCLGRNERIGQQHPFEFGASVLKVTRNTALKLQGKVNFAPCGVAFVKPEVRVGILPRMLTEILETRFMVKKAMKDHDKNDKTLQRVLHSRQLGLKFLANVTYGYTAANFTGRMPCMEVGDSVVSKGKETLERAIKLVESTAKWGARVVYGDTDSLFILAPGKSKDEAFKIGYEMAEAVTADNPSPVKLKFEKVLFPAILQTKKRYCGYMYESPEQEKPTYLAKGIETVRRDGCPAVSKILEKTLKILFDTKDVSQVKQYVVRQLEKILTGKVSLQDLTFAKEFRGMRGYKERACVPALELTRRLMKKDPRALPRHSERVKYVIIAGAPNQALIHCVRSPWEVLNDPGLRPNAVYYVTRVIIPPLNRCLNLMGVDVNTWYREMPHRHILHNPTALPGDKQKQTIFQYFGNIVCAACGQTSSRALCYDCHSRPSDTLVVLNEKLRWLERVYEQATSICQSCTGRGDAPQCISLDCPVLYRRAQAQRELTQGAQLERIIKQENIDF